MKKRLKDKKIEIYASTVISTPGKAPKYSWAPIHEGKLWAYVRQLSASEHFMAMQVKAKEEMLFVINWRSDISSTNVIKYRDKFYDIKRVDSFEGYKQDIQIYADVGVNRSSNL
ncbi:MAG: phage head closure protein [Firmicutes bacterium]|nr:phage head closure protein [Bacillota bacterium]